MRSAITIAAILAATPALAAPAWTADQASVCNTKPTTVDTMECLEARARVWDSRLNKAYKALNSVLPARIFNIGSASIYSGVKSQAHYISL
jgi:uncharacterized protein YecT (DUF1311 family)